LCRTVGTGGNEDASTLGLSGGGPEELGSVIALASLKTSQTLLPILQSIFPDCFGNFGIVIFDPLIVSMVMLTEPLNASLIAMAVVQEEPSPPDEFRQVARGKLYPLTSCVPVE
jgi:hypothetical protein